jgi:hypothetical protein
LSTTTEQLPPTDPTSYTGDSSITDVDTLDSITFTDHEKVAELKQYYPVTINNPQQIHGWTDPREVELVRLKAEKLDIIGKIRRGRSNIDNYYAKEMADYQSSREIGRSINGFERSEVTTSRRTMTTYTVPVRNPGTVDRFLSRLGRQKKS